MAVAWFPSIWRIKKFRGKKTELFRGCCLPAREVNTVRLPRPRLIIPRHQNNISRNLYSRQKMSDLDVAKTLAAQRAVDHYVKVVFYYFILKYGTKSALNMYI